VETDSVSGIGLVTPSRVHRVPTEGRYGVPRFHQEKIEGSATETPSIFIMEKFCLISVRKSVFGMIVAFGLAVLVPSLWAHQNQTGSDSPQAAWSSIQQLVKDMETAVQSKNLHEIHEPSMKIRAPIKTLKQHSSMLSGDKGQKIAAALKQLDSSVTDLHSAADEGSQAKSETALKTVQSALEQLKAQDPEAAFKNMD
jgi:hypothetical protein